MHTQFLMSLLIVIFIILSTWLLITVQVQVVKQTIHVMVRVFFNFGFKFQNGTHVDTIKKYQGMAGSSSSAYGCADFAIKLLIIQR